ncbi:hypothetical protein JCM6882_000069 [Rhodosporidiobolus microsporus]
MAWCLKQASGGGSLLKQPPTAHGEAFSSAWLLSLTSLIGGYSTVALNIPDFTRYARSNKGQWAQAPILPFFYLVTALFGVLSSFYGKVLWSPLDIYDQLWESRAAVSFCSAVWLLAQFSCNISGSSISAANDLSSLFPKYLNIRRGQVICAIIGGWVKVLYKVLSSGKVFLNFISSYAILHTTVYETDKIIENFLEIMSAHRGEVKVTITTAQPLEKDLQKRLEDSLKASQVATAGRNLVIENKVNSSVLGGLVIDFGDKTIDLSVASRVSRLNAQLQEVI